MKQLPNHTHTQPIISKGKPVKVVPKGSTKLVEQAKATWYVDYSYYNPNTESMQRIRITKGGNRIKDAKEKLQHFEALLEVTKELLAGGYNPLDEQSNAQLRKSIVSISLDEAKLLFEEYHKAKGTRKKSIQTYLSKVKLFIVHTGASKKVIDISDYDVTAFLNHYEKERKWTGVTYNIARISLNNFFRYLKVNRYITDNPVTNLETRKEIATESHQVFSDEDFVLIMDWLKQHDPYCLLFVRAIYYTCIRPKELRYLQLKHIDVVAKTITVPASIAKNKKAMPVSIDATFLTHLISLQLNCYSDNYYLFGSTSTIIGKNHIGENTPYNRFSVCLTSLKLSNKGYTLYSFKHLSNIEKCKSGWTLAEICRANRHSSLVETETYLKHLLKFVEITKPIPPI